MRGVATSTAETSANDILDLVGLTPLMEVTSGRPEMVIGLVDGPVLIDHPDLTSDNVCEIGGPSKRAFCDRANSFACVHGTFIAGILNARRGAAAPAICPGCTILVRPIFSETDSSNEPVPSTTADEVAAA